MPQGSAALSSRKACGPRFGYFGHIDARVPGAKMGEPHARFTVFLPTDTGQDLPRRSAGSCGHTDILPSRKKRSRHNACLFPALRHLARGHMNDGSAQHRLAAALTEVMTLRARLTADAALGSRWRAVKAFQSQRLSETYSDLLASERHRGACQFFLDEIYGTHDLGPRDRQALTVVPKLARVLPAKAVEALALAVDLDLLSENLDARVASRLPAGVGESVSGAGGTGLCPAAYAAAYREAGTPEERERQIRLVSEIGGMLDGLARLPLIPTMIRLARGPAEAAGFSHLHRFLETGFQAFRRMGRAEEFLQIVAHRETTLNDRLFAGDVSPFRAVP